MATYKITNVGSGLCLNISGDNVTTLTENQNVTLWADSGTNEQKWVIDSLGSGQFIRSAVDTAFGLNVWTSDNNCDVHTISGNEHDAMVDISLGTAGIRYTIKLSNYDLYLTAGGNDNGSNVYWAAATGGNDQYWTLFETDVASITPWSWSAANGQWATAYQTQLAYSAVSGKGKVSDFSWCVWNDLCDKVQECLTRAGESWYTYHGPNGSYTPAHAAAKMSETDKTLTAARFNAVRGNIGSHVAAGISPVNTGDKVLGSYFLTLVNSLNSWISSLNQGG